MFSGVVSTLTLVVLLSAAHSQSLFAQSAEVPAWVSGEPETVKIKSPAPPAYLHLTQTATVLRPKPLTGVAALEKLNPGLTALLPGLRDTLPKATVSTKFKSLYDAKIKAVATGEFMPAHFYFDCATVLNLTDARTGQRAVLIQADMDVDTDGTDPARLWQLKDYDDARISGSFQPVLAYSWANSGSDANPFIDYYKSTLTQLRGMKNQLDMAAEKDLAPVWTDLGKAFEEKINALNRKAQVYGDDLRNRRSLIASLDPFIVIPMNWVDKESSAFKMQVGDLVAVIYERHIYPCIIGDTGPNTQVGEGSQKLARALRADASGKKSAVTTAGVTYLVFPRSRPGMGEPNLSVYEAEVTHLLGQLGGIGEGVKVHSWKQTTALAK